MKQSSKKISTGTAALYCRLSRDDNMDSESNSIQNQKKIFQKAAKDKGYTDTIFFVDDGITGTTMKRPCFQKRMDVDTFLETVRRYTDATTITKRMVAELIQYIEVYPAVKEDGITNQRVTIHYNCIGAFEVPDRRKIPERDILMETRKGVALSYAPTQIAI